SPPGPARLIDSGAVVLTTTSAGGGATSIVTPLGATIEFFSTPQPASPIAITLKSPSRPYRYCDATPRRIPSPRPFTRLPTVCYAIGPSATHLYDRRTRGVRPDRCDMMRGRPSMAGP